MKSFVKWPGGKKQLVERLIERLPENYTQTNHSYFEPFIGGGALFLALEEKKATINDLNSELINCYKVIKDKPEELMDKLSSYQDSFNLLMSADEKKQYYYDIRDKYNSLLMSKSYDEVELAALLVFLNKSCFNGLYRVNSKGLFNTPFGHKESVKTFDKDNIIGVSKLLKDVKIENKDFEDVCQTAQKGDFVFFDSPYFDTFDTYQKGGFSIEDHKRLARLFKELTDKGVYCMLTNSNTDFIKGLYSEYNIDVVPVKRMINCNGNKRTGEEVIIRNYGN